MLVCGFDSARIRGAAGPEERSVFACTRNQNVDYFDTHVEVFRRHRIHRGARIGFAPNSLLARINSLRWQKNPCSSA
jgi:hypothetical protein